MAERAGTRTTLLPATPVASVADHIAAGGGEGLRLALQRGPEAVVEEVSRAGLRGRGGAGFPTGRKWRTVRDDPCATRYLVCNAAEGEPGTFKDRRLLRDDPYLVVEGTAIAAFAVGADGAFIALKRAFEPEVAALERAIGELRAHGLLGPVPLELVAGPEDYLFGEEKALLEVIEGKPPLPRILPPYQVGLFAAQRSPNPTVVNNVETLANVPLIMRHGAAWFRSRGTPSSPGSMLFTLVGDVRRSGVYELPLGATLGHLIHDVGGGPQQGRTVKAVFPGASNRVLVGDQLDLALDFDAMRQAGSALGSAGFVVYDDSACMVGAAAAFSRFLYAESCGQCPACKQGSRIITECLERLERGTATDDDLDTVRSRCRSVTGGARCGLPVGESLLVSSVLDAFGDEFAHHVDRGCSNPRRLPVPELVDFDASARRFVYEGRSAYQVQPSRPTLEVGAGDSL